MWVKCLKKCSKGGSKNVTGVYLPGDVFNTDTMEWHEKVNVDEELQKLIDLGIIEKTKAPELNEQKAEPGFVNDDTANVKSKIPVNRSKKTGNAKLNGIKK